MTLDLAYLLDFLALAETGSFSRAALARNMTQPAFSRRIRALEDWAGTPLFHRGSTPIGLTDAGRAMQPSVASALAALTQGRLDARTAASRGGAALHFAATHVLSFNFFPSWLRGLDGGQPLESVQLSSDSLSACEAMMREGRVHFLLCHHHPAAPVRLDPGRFPSMGVGSDVLMPVSAPNETGEPRFSLTPSPVPPPSLSYSEGSGLGRILAATLPKPLARPSGGVGFSSHLAAALRSLAIMGSGVAWLPRSLIDEDLSASRLVRAADPTLDVPVEIHLFRSNLNPSKAAERFWLAVSDTESA